MEQNTVEKIMDLSTATAREKAEELIRILYEKLALDIRFVDVSSSSEITDYYIITTGRSTTHVKSLADEIQFEAERRCIPFHHMEGRDGAMWLLLDFCDVIVHVFTKDARENYQIERLFKDENFVDISNLIGE